MPMTTAKALSELKCPACGAIDIHPSRRKSALEKLAAFFGMAYFRCHACKHRFSLHTGGFASRSMEREYLMLKQRIREIVMASGLLVFVVMIVIWMIGKMG